MLRTIAIGTVLAIGGLFAQQPDAARFEVASVKLNVDPAVRMRGLRPLPNGRLVATNATVRMMLVQAYGVLPYQLAGGPSWLDTDGYDIEAKGDPAANQTQVLAMLRSLLEERFQLRHHHESRDLPAYALTVAKNGPKLPAPKEGGCVV